MQEEQEVREEWEELAEALTDHGQGSQRVEEELGDLLFAIANLARHLEINPEEALRRAGERFSDRFMLMEQLAEASQQPLNERGIDDLEQLWQDAKRRLRLKSRPTETR